MISVRFGFSLSLPDNSMHTEKSKPAVQNTGFESESKVTKSGLETSTWQRALAIYCHINPHWSIQGIYFRDVSNLH